MGCQKNQQPVMPENDDNTISFNCVHPSQSTRVAGDNFEENDQVGLYCVEYVDTEPQTLQIGGNFINNELLSYNGTAWSSSRTLYWSDVAADFYAYYPYAELESVNSHIFAIATDQRTESGKGYELSDFLHAKSSNVSHTADGDVDLQFRHILTKLNVEIVKGDTFEGELPEEIEVNIYNTVTTAKVDLTVGSATKYAYGQHEIINMKQVDGDTFTAIVVPQFIAQLTPLIEINMEGISYLLNYSISLRPSCEHTITVIVNTSPDQEKIEISIDGTVNDWN